MLMRVEGTVRRLGAALAVVAAALAVPGIASSARRGGASLGQPGRVFSPSRLAAITLAWLGLSFLAWRPLPVRPAAPTRTLLLVAGAPAYALGLGLAIAGRLALGTSYRPSSTVGLELAPGHRLVTSGPYALVRHPMYLGLGLAAVGALALYRTWTTLLLVAQLPVLVVRARREEELLGREFGDAWSRYARRVPAWVPWSQRGGRAIPS